MMAKKIEVAGLEFGNFKLGRFRFEPTFCKTASNALMLTKASQYHLCKSIKGIGDEDTRNK